MALENQGNAMLIFLVTPKSQKIEFGFVFSFSDLQDIPEEIWSLACFMFYWSHSYNWLWCKTSWHHYTHCCAFWPTLWMYFLFASLNVYLSALLLSRWLVWWIVFHFSFELLLFNYLYFLDFIAALDQKGVESWWALQRCNSVNSLDKINIGPDS